jgi:hypothetical protein
MPPRQGWTRDQSLVAFALYCRTPFGRLHSRNPEIISLANAIGKTPSAVAMKCVNFASLDPEHRERGRVGLRNASRQDRQLWDDFHADPEQLIQEAAAALAEYQGGMMPESDAEWPDEPPIGRDREALTRVRVNQAMFRRMILVGYREQCAVCELPLAGLLVAAHIIPWVLDSTHRMNPKNGLCLCGTHDLAYEKGILRINREYRIEINLAGTLRDAPPVEAWLTRFDGALIHLPVRWHPDPELLDRRFGLAS